MDEGQHSARKELPKLPLDEPQEAGAFASGRHLAHGILQVLADDRVEHGVLRVTGSIRRLGKRHALRYSVRPAAPLPKDAYTVSTLRRDEALGRVGYDDQGLK